MMRRLETLRVWLADIFGGLPRRAILTIRYRGLGSFLFRAITFPLRLTPLARRLPIERAYMGGTARARAWYSRNWHPVTVVIPTYGPPDHAIAAVRALRRTTDRDRVRIVVADDASPAEHRERLRDALDGKAELVLGEENAGFARTANAGIRLAAEGDDLVLMNSDVIPLHGWIEALQHAARADGEAAIVGPKLLYPDRTIQSAGSYRNLGAPEWFDHRYRFRPAGHPPAGVATPVIAVTGACMYVKRHAADELGLLDERYPMAYEDVDWCLRAWDAGMTVAYEPSATLIHHEAKTRGMEQGERELRSQRLFWERWEGWFDGRNARTDDGRLRLAYVTEDAGVGGGHRVAFEHLNRLAARGHECVLYTLTGPPDWFDLQVPTRTFDDYDELAGSLAGLDAIKVATWWRTAEPVWLASVRRGVPVYLVQDIETSYYPRHPELHADVLASYREEHRYLTTSGWVGDRLREMNLDPVAVAPGVDLETFHDLGRPREEGVVLTLGRSQPLKNLDLTIQAWRSIGNERPQLWMFGVEPEVAEGLDGARYFTGPSDQRVNDLLNEATVLVQTSRHEGFCLPLLEAMAAGTPVVCTDAHGNRDFCRDAENCLMVDSDPASVRVAIGRLLDDSELRGRLAEEGRRTAQRYAWDARIDELERFFESVAPARAVSRV